MQKQHQLRGLLILFILLICITHPTFSQITKVEFIKVKGDVNEYLSIEKEWRKLHQKRLENESIYAWYLVQRHFGGTEADYDFMTVTVFPNMGALQTAFTQEQLAVLDPEILNKTPKVRDVVKTEIYDTPIILEITTLPQFLNMTFMKVDQGNDEEYLEIEDEIWKPAHAEIKKSGVLNSWSVYRQLYPGGYGGDYNYVTVNGYADMKKVTFGPPDGWQEFMKTIHPDHDIAELFERTNSVRLIVKNELWEILDTVAPQ